MVRPPYLKQGDEGVILAPAKKIENPYIQAAIEAFKRWGLKIHTGRHLFDNYYRYSGDDAARLEDLQQAIDNPDIKLIVAGRGGYGTNRIIDQINWRKFVSYPKWIVGFSDITVLLGELNRRQVMGIHGIMPSFFLWENADISILALQDMLFGTPPKINSEASNLNIKGTCEGQLIGGNLAILTSMIGTSSDYEYQDKILLIEEVSESPYRIDRMMVQLKRTGKLAALKGIVCGQFSDCDDDDDPFGKTAYEIVREHTEQLNIPVGFNFPIGHTAINYPVIIGGEYLLKVENEIASLEPIV